MNVLDLLIQAGPLGQKTLKLMQLYPKLRGIIEAIQDTHEHPEILTLREALKDALNYAYAPELKEAINAALNDQ